MDMKQGMEKWLKKHQPTMVPWVNPCHKMFPEGGDNLDACITLAQAHENGKLTEGELVTGLHGITGIPVGKIEEALDDTGGSEKEVGQE